MAVGMAKLRSRNGLKAGSGRPRAEEAVNGQAEVAATADRSAPARPVRNLVDAPDVLAANAAASTATASKIAPA